MRSPARGKDRPNRLAEEATSHDPTAMLHTLFEAHATATPDATAVVIDGDSLTYEQLNRHANKLAHHLVNEFRVGPEDRVGMIVDRSERMLISMLAIMKAGGAYVPIDPKYPAKAIQYMLRDSEAKAFLVDSEHLGKVVAFSGRSLILDMELETLTTTDGNPRSGVDPSNLAYTIYTSGSTGRRKGVAIEHRAIVRTIEWRQGFYGLDASTVNIQIPSYALDSSVVDIFGTLLSGGRLVLLREDARTDVNYIRRRVSEHDATHMLATPTFYRLLLPALEGTSSLECVTVAGEATTTDLVEEHFRVLPGTRLVNEYGPTENAVCSTAIELESGSSYVSLGTPIAHTDVHLLDDKLQPVADGSDGEIYLGGARLARSYWNRPGLTAERFIPDPHSNRPGRRLYRTGDVARRRPDGGIEFRGRLDDQVKIRGFRVELGELAFLLRAHPDVRDGVAICHGAGDNKRLVAYAVPEGPATSSDLRTYLANLVPDHMVPSAVVMIAQIPMTPNGKIDRAALPDPGAIESDAAPDTAPRNEAEEAMVGLWLDILNIGHLGVHDNFFEIGGNSLRAAQLQSEIYSRFGVDMSLHELFSGSTVAELASVITRNQAD